MKTNSLFLVLSLLGLAVCTHDAGDETASTESPLTTLTAQECRTPSVTTAQKATRPATRSKAAARATPNGCVVGKTGETGRTSWGARPPSRKHGRSSPPSRTQGERLFTSPTPVGFDLGLARRAAPRSGGRCHIST